MYIFDLLNKISEFSDNLTKFMSNLLNKNNIVEDEDINNTILNKDSLVDIINNTIDLNNNLDNELDSYLNQINIHNSLQISIKNNTNNIHSNLINSISEIYQFNNLLSYSNQFFMKNDKKNYYIIKANIDDKDMILFNTMISADYPSNKVVFYSTSNKDGIFKNEIIPAVIYNGYYHISVKISVDKILEESTAENLTYKINDNNGYITAIAYI